jgi:hypothetical protein
MELYSVKEYRGFKIKQQLFIDDQEYVVWRIDDRKNEIALLKVRHGFKYIDIDDLIELLNK